MLWQQVVEALLQETKAGPSILSPHLGVVKRPKCDDLLVRKRAAAEAEGQECLGTLRTPHPVSDRHPAHDHGFL